MISLLYKPHVPLSDKTTQLLDARTQSFSHLSLFHVEDTVPTAGMRDRVKERGAGEREKSSVGNVPWPRALRPVASWRLKQRQGCRCDQETGPSRL